MPQVPVIPQEGLPDLRVPTEAPIEAFGGGRAGTAFEGAENLAGTAEKIEDAEKQKADDLATTEAYTKTVQMKNALLWDPKNGVMARQGKDAFGVVDEFMPQFEDGADAIEKGLANADQRAIYQRMRLKASEEFDGELQRHMFEQRKVYDDQTTDAGVAAERDNAIQNYATPGAVGESLRIQNAMIAAHGQRNGMDGVAIQQLQVANASKTHAGVIDRMLTNGQTADARKYFDSNKTDIKGEELTHVEKLIDNAQTIDQGMAAWQKVAKYRLPDGNPDEARMEASVMAMPNLSTEKKLRIWEFVKGRAGEAVANRLRSDSASDRSFMNQAVQARQSGAPLDTVLKLAARAGRDPYDTSIKQDMVRKMYAPSTTSNPATFINLWEKTQDKTASRDEIDNAFRSNDLNTADWRTLREGWYKSQLEGEDPKEKANWDRIRALADEKFGSDKVGKEKFIYELHAERPGKSPEEIWKIANDKLKGNPNTGFFGFFQSAQWKADLERMDASNLAWGKLYQDLGKNETRAIGEGLQAKGGKFSPGDVDSFAQSFGGYSSIKPGTPAHNAIQSLMKHRQLVTPANVKAVLDRYKDGRY